MAETDGKTVLTMASGVTPQPLDEETSAEMARLNPHVGSNLPMCVSGGWRLSLCQAGRQAGKRERERERERERGRNTRPPRASRC